MRSFLDRDKSLASDVKLTHFAHIGEVHSSVGQLHVVYVQQVIRHMLCPRGAAFLLFFDPRCVLRAKINITNRQPLWCSGSYVFMFGRFRWLGRESGNAWDVSRGPDDIRLVTVPEYGSYEPELEAPTQPRYEDNFFGIARHGIVGAERRSPKEAHHTSP
ncbi:MAG: hypothetical protein ACYTKD_19005 [Planctomycetota bacterium]|jgi:hypothetical protein